MAAVEQDFMGRAPDFTGGVIPSGSRNAGYKKLGFAPGSGGLGGLLESVSPKSSETMEAFLAGVAAGADPRELAKELRSDTTPRRRRGQ